MLLAMWTAAKPFVFFLLSPVWWLLEKIYGDEIFDRLRPMIPAFISDVDLNLLIAWAPPALMIALGSFMFWRVWKRIDNAKEQAAPVDGAACNLTTRNLRSASNKDLAAEVGSLCTRLRDFQDQYNSAMSRIYARYPEDADVLERSDPAKAAARREAFRACRDKAHGVFLRDLRPGAIALRDEMHKRLGVFDYDPLEQMHSAFMGMLAGVRPAEEMAEYLEHLARQLP